jgi:DNA-binding transcriptional MerR regulator
MDPNHLTLPPDEGEREATNGAPLGLPIGEVSRTVGVSPQTLRAWEREELIAPLRSRKGTRYYTHEDLERLREVKRLRTVHGLNFAAIRREMGAAGKSPANASGERLPKSVVNRLRRTRVRQGKTLKEMAMSTGLSPLVPLFAGVWTHRGLHRLAQVRDERLRHRLARSLRGRGERALQTHEAR